MSYKAQLIQRDLIFNVDNTITGQGYTVAVMEDTSTNFQYINYEFFDDEGNEIEDEQIIIEILQAIESIRN